VVHADDFQVFWSCGTSWGIFSMNNVNVSLRVHFGKIELKNFGFKPGAKSKIESIQIEQNTVTFKPVSDRDFLNVQFKNPVHIQAGEALTIKMKQ